MDPVHVFLVGFLAFLIGVAVLAAQLRLFSIDARLKQIVALLEAEAARKLPPTR